MIYSELTFFDGAAFAHIADWEESKRLTDRKESSRRAIASKR